MLNRRKLITGILLWVSCWGYCRLGYAQSSASPIDPAEVEFFEREIRPILVDHCQSCHGAKKQEMSLRLDSAQGLLLGGDNGPVIVVGEPDESLLIEAIRYSGDTKMPPSGKLPAGAIASLERWVKQGAVWPKEAAPPATAASAITAEAAKNHWAFQPIRSPAVPTVRAPERVARPIDTFILARLEAAQLTLSPPADRHTLIRRATYDLHGLPPTSDEVSAFENDSAPDAFGRVIDRLLSSPRYGERWGRHWLDVARYSDTKGYVRLNENPRYPSSWTYRDYVISALNDDLPYDQFVREQLAADLLLANDAQNRRSLAALGYLTLGQRFLNSTPDIIDDRIDVVSRGLLGMTVSCARCHDHKFDPIPTRDYYGLYGVFANSVEPRLPPLILPASQQSQYASYLTELQSRSDQLEEYLRTQQAALTTSMRSRAGEYLLAGQHDPVQANFLAVMFLIDASKDLNPVMTQRWARHLEQSRKGHDPVLAPWHELARFAKHQAGLAVANPSDLAASSAEFAAHVSQLVVEWRLPEKETPRINRVVVEALLNSPPRNLAEASQLYGTLLHEAGQRWQDALQATPAATQLVDPEWEELRQLLMGADSPFNLTIADVDEFLFVDATTQQQLHAKQRLVTDWIGSAGAAPHAMALEDAPSPTDAHVFIRGNASNPGEVAPRQFLSALSPADPQPFSHGSGRLDLALAITHPQNPLTARVIVNRVWMHHFGAGLVRTPSDFGLRGERPTHPELLDHLASQFIAQGWSLKSLHREIMLSSTYQQQSVMGQPSPHAAARLADPENLLLWSMNRRRLDWESLRDAMLAASGQLDLSMGGPSVDLFQPAYSSRRSVYGLIDRQSLSSELRTFDFAPPDASSPQRHQTTVPQQALFLMNSPFLKQQVEHLAARLDSKSDTSVKQKIDAAYQSLFGRSATPREVELGQKYLTAVDSNDTAAPDATVFFSPWEEYLQALLLSNEFMFVD